MSIFISQFTRTLLKINILLTLVISLIPAAGFTKDWSLQALQIVLPDKLQQIAKQESYGVDYYWLGDRNTHMKIVRIHKVPTEQSQWNTWQTDMLGKQIALWRETSGQSLESQQQVLSQKPQAETIGKFTYHTAEMSFPSEKVKFLNIIEGEFTYMFTLISTDPNLTLRDQNMKELLESLKTFIPKPAEQKSVIKPSSAH